MEIWCAQCNKAVDEIVPVEKAEFPRLYDCSISRKELLVKCHGRTTPIDASIAIEHEKLGEGQKLLAFFDSEELEERDNPD